MLRVYFCKYLKSCAIFQTLYTIFVCLLARLYVTLSVKTQLKSIFFVSSFIR